MNGERRKGQRGADTQEGAMVREQLDNGAKNIRLFVCEMEGEANMFQ